MISVDLVDLEDVMRAWRLWSSDRWSLPFNRRILVSDLAPWTERYVFVCPTSFEQGIRERAFAPGVVDRLSELTPLRLIDRSFWTWLEGFRFEGELDWLNPMGTEPEAKACLLELRGRLADGALFERPIRELLARASQTVGPSLKVAEVSQRPTTRSGVHRTLSLESAYTGSRLLHDAAIHPAVRPPSAARHYSVLVSPPRIWRATRRSTMEFIENMTWPDESVAEFEIVMDVSHLRLNDG